MQDAHTQDAQKDVWSAAVAATFVFLFRVIYSGL